MRTLLLLIALTLPSLAGAEPDDLAAGLPEATRARIKPLTADPTARVELPRRALATRLPIYDCLLAELPMTGALVRALELGAYKIDAGEGGTVEVDDGKGATASLAMIRHLQANAQRGASRLYLGKGRLTMLWKQLTGDALIEVRYRKTEAGVEATGTIFFRAVDPGLHRWGKRLRGTLAAILKNKAAAFVTAAAAVSERTHARPERVLQLLPELEAPRSARQRLRRLLEPAAPAKE